MHYNISPTAAVTFLIPSIILFWLGFQFIGSYLKIYSDGIGVRKPYRLFRHKFIPWSSIKEVQYFDRGVLLDEDSFNFSFKPFNSIDIFLIGGKKSRKTIEISNIWVDQLETAYKLLKDHVIPQIEPENCEFHSSIKPSKRCMKCGRWVCSACIEEKSIFGTLYEECSLCLYKQGLRRVRNVSIISMIFPALILLRFIFSFFVPPPIYPQLIQPNDASPMFTFLIAVSITPYGFGLITANIQRNSILNKLKIDHSLRSFVILLMISLFIYIFYFVLFYAINEFLMLGWTIWTVIYALIAYGYDSPRKKVLLEDNVEFQIKTLEDKFTMYFLKGILAFYIGLIGLAIFGVIWKSFLAPPEINEDLLWLIIRLYYGFGP